jgi:hypothetical protein
MLVCVACGDPEVSALRADVTKLTQRLDKLEQTSAPSWSCAANCIVDYHCRSGGTSTLNWQSKTATGATGAEAFTRLATLCDRELYVDGDCVNGNFVRTQATLPNACVRN